jgi:hypothetical protein
LSSSAKRESCRCAPAVRHDEPHRLLPAPVGAHAHRRQQLLERQLGVLLQCHTVAESVLQALQQVQHAQMQGNLWSLHSTALAPHAGSFCCTKDAMLLWDLPSWHTGICRSGRSQAPAPPGSAAPPAPPAWQPDAEFTQGLTAAGLSTHSPEEQSWRAKCKNLHSCRCAATPSSTL